jgi:hypothetical protein
MGAYRIPLETGLLIPSDKSRNRVRREKAVVHSGSQPARELVRSTR